ncbi:MAG: TetR/AcrR family transcriptional regulator [Paracoccaceae bacterium]|nr:MAG: TetR/AcrR family transcriptional regulator [Paracoccaceae bacterium]
MGAAAQPAIRKGRKFEQVLDGARLVFMRDGYEGASVDDIAREAGVSKATLYAYFPDKRMLFVEVAKGECCRQAEEAEALVNSDMRVEQALTIAAHKMTDFFCSDVFLRIFRVVVSEAERFPELGREFFDNGPAQAKAKLIRYIAERVGRGELVCDDPALAADQFAELCKADLFPRLVFGVNLPITAADRHRVVCGAVEMFMARYGAAARRDGGATA